MLCPWGQTRPPSVRSDSGALTYTPPAAAGPRLNPVEGEPPKEPDTPQGGRGRGEGG